MNSAFKYGVPLRDYVISCYIGTRQAGGRFKPFELLLAKPSLCEFCRGVPCPALRVVDTVTGLSFGMCCGMWAYYQVPVAPAVLQLVFPAILGPAQFASLANTGCCRGVRTHGKHKGFLCKVGEASGPLLRPGCATCVCQLLQPFAMSLHKSLHVLL